MIDLLVALVGNLVSYLRTKLEFESVTPDTAFRFNSKDVEILEVLPKKVSQDIIDYSGAAAYFQLLPRLLPPLFLPPMARKHQIELATAA
jgi:hypothetical protein